LNVEKTIKGFVVAATKSNSGKTTVTLGILAALIKRGIKVAPFKVGPDFIDPGHHGHIAKAISRNLDGWMLSPQYNRATFSKGCEKSELAVVEGVMGLFDGYDGQSEAGSTAEMAKWLNLPVLLVVDARSMARSAAALLQGFENFDDDLRFAGVIFNQVGSPRHLDYLSQAIKGHVNLDCLGGIPRDGQISIPERHLGLHTAYDHPLDDRRIDALAAMIEDNIDLDKLLNSLPNGPLPFSETKIASLPSNQNVRIGVAKDKAFCFYYQDNLDLLAAAGAEIVPFSPLTDSCLPDNLDGLYLGGGYPELYAETLSQNQGLNAQIKQAATGDMPIYGECGGFMYLGQSIQDKNGRQHPMAGIFPFKFKMLNKLKSLGYREITLANDTILGKSGSVMRGHEFHYSEITGPNDSETVSLPTAYKVTTRAGLDKTPQGYQFKRCLGSYLHLHFGSNPDIAKTFITSCRRYKKIRSKKPGF
jgi:cobyrinic acid a,c-diamide synthase